MAWTSPRTFVAAETVTAAIMNTHIRDNLLELNGTSNTWTAYTPVWAAGTNPTLSSAFGRYKRIGNLVTVQFEVITSATATSGIWKVSLPLAPRVLGGSYTPLGSAMFRTTTFQPLFVILSGTTQAQFFQVGGTAAVTGTVAISDAIDGVLSYEV